MNKLILICLGLLYFIANTQKSFALNRDSVTNEINQNLNESYIDYWIDSLGLSNNINNPDKMFITNRLLEKVSKEKYPLKYAKLQFRKSILLTIQGNLNAAMELVNEVIPIFEEKSHLELAACYNTAGGMISRLGETEKAKLYLRKAISITDTLVKESKAVSLSNSNYLVLGNIYFIDAQLDSAKYLFEKALKLSADNTLSRIYSLTNLSSVFNEEKNFLESIKLNRKAMQIALKIFPELNGNIYVKLGQSFLRLKQYDSSILYINKAIGLAKKMDLNSDLSRAYLVKVDYYKARKQYQKAVSSFEKYKEVKQKEDAANKNVRVAFMVEQTKIQDQKESALRIEKEKGKQRNLQLLLFTLLGVVLITGLITYFWYQRRKLRQQLEKDKIEKEMFKSQIRAINSQMNPHFVFNSLNSIQELIVLNDIRNSNIYLGKFADLMRKTLEYSQEDEIQLKKELEVLKLYLDLEQKRFGDELKINFNINVSENLIENFDVPSLLFQPYVENALKHGLLHKDGLKILDIIIEEQIDYLVVIIEDNGIGRHQSKKLKDKQQIGHNSYALNANAKRLELIKYSSGKNIQVKFIDKVDDRGTKVIFTLPKNAI